jgi:general secretion pathway protein M
MIAKIRSIVLARRVTFVAVHIATMMALYWLFIPLWDIFADRDAKLAEQRALLVRLEGVAAREGDVQDVVRNATAEIERAEFLAGANDGVVGADLQTRLKAIAEAGGARLQSVQSLPATQDGGIKYVGARIELIGTLAAIQRAIHAMESGKPYLFITAAVLKSASPISRPDQTAEPVAAVQLDAFGALRPEVKVR